MFICTPVPVLSLPSIEVYIYSFPEYSTSETLHSYFESKSNWTITYCDLKNISYVDEFLNIIYILQEFGVEIVPSGGCSCELYYASPLIVFFKNRSLNSVTVATTNSTILDKACTNTENAVKIFTISKSYNSTDENARTQLEEVFARYEGKADVSTSILDILPLIIMAASVDAINPCAFYVLIVLLSTVFFNIGRKNVLKAGIAYSIAIFIIYSLMGFGILHLFSYIKQARLLVVVFGFSIGLRAVLNFLFGVFGLSFGFRDMISTALNKKLRRVPKIFSEKLSVFIKGTAKKPMMAFIIGVVASVFLLPCTSGPYLIALSLIADLETALAGILLLILYNSIIISPFLVITLGIYTLKLKTNELKKWSSRKQKWINLMAGLLMILISLYLIFTVIS